VTAVFAIVRSELTKILTAPFIMLVTGIILVLDAVILLQPMQLYADAVANITPEGVIEIFRGQRRPAEEALVGQLVAASLQAALFVPVLGALIAGQEFRDGQIGTSVLAVPRRGRLLVGKTIATASFVVLVAILISSLSSLFMYVAVREWDPSILWSGAALLGQAKFVFFAVSYTITVFAVTVAAGRTLAGIITIVVFLGLTMSQVLAAFAPWADALVPMSAGRNLLLDPVGNALTGDPGSAAVVMVAWVLVTVCAAAVVLRRRDAR
jgi:ABC-type transport system involved in multi-copper enzyme maturation permease subunit